MAVRSGAATIAVPAAKIQLGLRDRIRPKLLVLGGVMTAIFAAFLPANTDPDFWWHLRDAQWIVDHRALPATDLYTFTAAGHPWTDHEYLGEVLTWLVYRWGGTIAVSLVLGVVIWAGFLLIFRMARATRRPYGIAAIGLGLGAAAGLQIWSPRLQMVTFLFACVELLWLQSFRSGASRWLYALPILVALWANLHAGWAVAFVFLAVALLAEGIEWWFDRADPTHREKLARLGAVTLISALAVGATPHGFALYLYPFQTQGSAAQQSFIIEWLSPNFHNWSMRIFEAMALLLLIGFAIRRPRAYELLLCVATLAMALQSIRHVVLFVAAATPILIATWSDIWLTYRDRLPGAHLGLPRSAFVSTMSVLVLLGVAGGTTQHAASALGNQALVTNAAFPVVAADWMQAHRDQLGSRMFNQYGWGGYLAYRFYPDASRRVFVFGEAQLMGDSLLIDYQRVQDVTPQWQAVLDKYRVDYVVFNRGYPLDVLLRASTSWKLVYEDPVAVIYVRKS